MPEEQGEALFNSPKCKLNLHSVSFLIRKNVETGRSPVSIDDYLGL
jgi:hypothetical protein